MLMRVQRNFHQSFVLALMSSAFCLRLGTTVQAFSAYGTAATPASTMVNTARAAAASSTTPRNRLPFSSKGLSKGRPRQLLRPRALPCSRLASSASDAGIPRSPGAGAAFRAADNLAGGAEDFGQQQVQQPAGVSAGQGFGAKQPAVVGKPAPGPSRQRPPPKKAQPKAPPRGDNLLVVGLGNPGDKYKMTRHNAGFLVAEELARRHGGALKIKNAFQGEYCSVTVKGKSVGILRPITFMNNSGMAARKVIDFFKLPIGAALVLVDEVALDFGQLRLKGKGGAGGHNGLKSLQAHLKTPEYSRLRIGVGAPGSAVLSDHVLGEFSRTERKELDSIVAEACDAVEHWIEEEDMAKVQTRCNSR